MKRILIVLLVTVALAACGDNTNERIKSEPTDNNVTVTPDSSNLHTDTAGGRNNPNSNQDSLRYN